MAGSTGNRFYVEPMLATSDIARSFQQGQQIRAGRDAQEQQAQQQEREQAFREAMSAATSDMERAAILRQFPEKAQEVAATAQFSSQASRDQHLNTYSGLRKAATVEDGIAIMQDHIKRLDAAGVDSTESRADLERLVQGMSVEEMQAMGEVEMHGHERGRATLESEKKSMDARPGATEVEKLQAAIDRLPEGSPMRGRYEKLRDDAIARSGQDVRKGELDIQKAEMDLQALEQSMADLAAGGLPPEDAVKVEGELRDEIHARTKEFQKSEDAWRRMQAASQGEASAAGDMAMIFAYMKILDPGSTVREGEFATAQNAGGVSTKAMNVYNSILSGEKLTAKQRADFMKQGEKIYNGAKGKQDNLLQNYRELATQYKVDPARVVLPGPAGMETTPPGGAGGAGSLPTATGPDDPVFLNLPSGAKFIGPDGREWIKD